MRFFSNKIYVNGASKSFDDIVQDVAGGMKKQASVQDDVNKDVVKEAKNKSKGKLTPKQKKLPPALKKAILGKKSSINGEEVKIASINSKDNDTAEVEFSPVAEKYAEIEISDDGHVKSAEWSESMMDTESSEYAEGSEEGADNAEPTGEEGEEGEKESAMGCESCGTTMASSSDFVKVANLTDKQKSAFRSYWQNVWPKEFIDAVLDKDQ